MKQLQLFNIESFAPAPAQTDWAVDVAGDDYDEEEWYLAQTAGINPETGEAETGEEDFTQTYRNHTAHFLKTEREWQIEFKFINPDRPGVTLWTDTLDRDVAIRYFQKNVDGIIEYYHQKKHEVAAVFGWEKLHQLFPEHFSPEVERDVEATPDLNKCADTMLKVVSIQLGEGTSRVELREIDQDNHLLNTISAWYPDLSNEQLEEIRSRIYDALPENKPLSALLESSAEEDFSWLDRHVADLEKCSGESPKHQVSPEPKLSAPDDLGSGEKPNYYHWVETYWVSRRGEKHLYYRYCWSEGKQRHHCHIRGGNIRSPLAQQHKQQVEDAIALGQPPEDIMDLMDHM